MEVSMKTLKITASGLLELMNISRSLDHAGKFELFERIRKANGVITPDYISKMANRDIDTHPLNAILFSFTGMKEAIEEIMRRDQEGTLRNTQRGRLSNLSTDDILDIIDTLAEDFKAREFSKMSLDRLYLMMVNKLKERGLYERGPSGTPKQISTEETEEPTKNIRPRQERVLDTEQEDDLGDLNLPPLDQDKTEEGTPLPFADTVVKQPNPFWEEETEEIPLSKYKI